MMEKSVDTGLIENEVTLPSISKDTTANDKQPYVMVTKSLPLQQAVLPTIIQSDLQPPPQQLIVLPGGVSGEQYILTDSESKALEVKRYLSHKQMLDEKATSDSVYTSIIMDGNSPCHDFNGNTEELISDVLPVTEQWGPESVATNLNSLYGINYAENIKTHTELICNQKAVEDIMKKASDVSNSQQLCNAPANSNAAHDPYLDSFMSSTNMALEVLSVSDPSEASHCYSHVEGSENSQFGRIIRDSLTIQTDEQKLHVTSSDDKVDRDLSKSNMRVRNEVFAGSNKESAEDDLIITRNYPTKPLNNFLKSDISESNTFSFKNDLSKKNDHLTVTPEKVEYVVMQECSSVKSTSVNVARDVVSPMADLCLENNKLYGQVEQLEQEWHHPLEEKLVSDSSLSTALNKPLELMERNDSSKSKEEQLAIKFKEEGNKYFKNGDTERAIDCYTKGIQADPSNFVLFSNRAASYIKLMLYEKALQDADVCIKLCPSFIKGHSRRCTSLLELGRPYEAIQAADVALSLSNEPKNDSIEIVVNTKRNARLQLLKKALGGTWKGTVNEQLGAYKQTFYFDESSNKMTISIFGKPSPAIYTLHQPSKDNRVPLWMDIKTVTEDRLAVFMEQPTIPYIYRLFYRDTITDERILYDGTSEWPPIAGSISDEKRRNLDEKLKWELEICCPYLSLSRPEVFDGAGFVLMEKCFNIEEPRPITQEIFNLSFQEQICRYLEDLLQMNPKSPVEEPSGIDDNITSATKLAALMKWQFEVLELAKRFPDSVSSMASQLLLPHGLEEEFTFFEISQQRERKIENFSRRCQNLFKQASRHLEQTGFFRLELSLASFNQGEQIDADIGSRTASSTSSRMDTEDGLASEIQSIKSADADAKMRMFETENACVANSPSKRGAVRKDSNYRNLRILITSVIAIGLSVGAYFLIKSKTAKI